MEYSAEDAKALVEHLKNPAKRGGTSVGDDTVNYPSTNKASYCWQLYNEFLVCKRKKGADECHVPRSHVTFVCPQFWVDQWDELSDAGRFPGIQLSAPSHH